jgi:hypothetical protein
VLTKVSEIHIGKIPLGETRHRWDDNVKMNLEETGCEGATWIQLVWYRI